MTVVTLAIAIAIWLLAGCGEGPVHPGVQDGAPTVLGTNPDAADIGNIVHGIENVPVDCYDVHFVPGTFLVTSGGGIIAVQPNGDSFLFSSTAGGRSIEVVGTRIFVRTVSTILEYDHSGSVIDVIGDPDGVNDPYDFAALSEAKFALFNNNSDSVFITTSDGTLLAGVPMPDPSPGRLQNTRGVRIGDKLVISETGTTKVMEMDLTTYDIDVFRDFSGSSDLGWLGDIDYRGGRFYLARPTMVQRFTEIGDLEDVWDAGDEEHPVGIELLEDYAYVAMNFAGKIYKIDLSTGVAAVLIDGLTMPSDIEYIPVRLEEPPPR
jgi:hypothetical protein